MIDDPGDPAAAVTRTLHAAGVGDRKASAALLPLVYDELRRLAGSRLARLTPGQTLQATALVHEAYIRLVGDHDPGWQGRAHFFGAAARAMRNVVADHLQRKGCLKRGGGLQRVGDSTACELSAKGPSDAALRVEEVLIAFEKDYPRQAEVMTLSIYGGLTMVEIAEDLAVSPRTAERDFHFAKAWLNSRLGESEDA